MTVIPETRHTREGKAYAVYTPRHLAADASFDEWFVEQLREFLHRRGCNVISISDEQLLMQTRHAFFYAGSNPPAIPVVSGV